jgi:uncharacterized delta-60 repeat protein
MTHTSRAQKPFLLLALATLSLGASLLGAAPPQAVPVTTVNPSASDCYSGAGCLDPAFGALGKVVQNIGGNPQYVYGVAAQADGKVVVVGSRRLIAVPNDLSWAIARFAADGALDTGFAAGGLAALDLISGVNNLEQARAVAIQPDGKIVVAGWGGSTGGYVAVVRFTPSGALDSTFGTGGKVVITSLGDNYVLTALALQPDGKIVAVAGQNTAPGVFSTVFRLNATGAVDTKFGSKGFRQLALGYMDVMALQSNGSIILGGSNAVGDATDFVLTRVNSSGTWDSKFGNRGTVALDFFGYEDDLSAMRVAGDDSIIVGGRVNTAPSSASPGVQFPATVNMGFARFTASGALVTSFGSGGRRVLDMNGGWDSVSDVALQSDGKTVFGGSARPADNSTGYFIAGRLTSSGSLDSSFGAGGVTETSVSFDDKSGGMATDSNGHIYIAGHSYSSNPTSNPNYWLVARYFR